MPIGCWIFLYSCIKFLWLLTQRPVNYEVFHSGWWKHATFWPHVSTVTFNIWGSSLSSGSLLTCMHLPVLCWIILGILCRSLVLLPCAFSHTLSCELKLLSGFPSPAVFRHLRNTDSLHLVLSSLSCCLETLQTTNGGNCRAYLIWFLSVRDLYPTLSDTQCLLHSILVV